MWFDDVIQSIFLCLLSVSNVIGGVLSYVRLLIYMNGFGTGRQTQVKFGRKVPSVLVVRFLDAQKR